MSFFIDNPAAMKQMGEKARKFVVDKGIVNENTYNNILSRLDIDVVVGF